MIDKWSKIRLGDICKTNKSTYSLSEKWDYVNYLDTGNLTQDKVTEYQHIVVGQDKLPSRARRKVEVDDILYSTVRPNQLHYGIAKKLLPNTLVSTGFAVITVDKKKANSDFIYYYLTQNDVTETLQAIGEQSTSAYPSIKPSDIEKLELNLPTLEEQEVIAHTLRSLDRKIEINREINHHLEQMAHAIFKSWFIDFEPFGGEIPDNWQETLLFDLATVTYGKNLPTKKLLDSGYKVFGGNGQIGYYNEYLFEAERILISCRGAASGTVRLSRPYSFVTNNSLVINEKSPLLFSYLKQWALNRQFFDSVTGSAQPQVTVDSLKLISLPLPDNDILQKFSDSIKPIYEKIELLAIENEKLIVLRDTLLPKLMSGEVSIAD